MEKTRKRKIMVDVRCRCNGVESYSTLEAESVDSVVRDMFNATRLLDDCGMHVEVDLYLGDTILHFVGGKARVIA